MEKLLGEFSLGLEYQNKGVTCLTQHYPLPFFEGCGVQRVLFLMNVP